MKLYKEWCLQPNQRRGTMLPLAQFKDIMRAPDAGYASVYAFEETAALEIIASKSSAGLNKYPVYSDMLMIDLDDGERQLRRAQTALIGFGYKIWTSGGKGFHIGLPLKVGVFGDHIPYSQRKWVEALDIGADLSLYQHGRILSLPGRVHPKTGKKKELFGEVMGLYPMIPDVYPARVTFAAFEDTSGDLETALWQTIQILVSEPEPGNRHTKLWATAKSLAEAGLAYETVLDLLTEVNSSWENSKTTAEVTTAVQQAYRK